MIYLKYPAWLFGFSLAFLIFERLLPRHPQRLLRRGFFSDLAYLVFNSEYLGMLLGMIAVPVAAHLRVHQWLDIGIMRGQPFWVQFPVLVLVMDFSRYLIHNLLHRVPWLWEFHKVHHSIEELDWIGDWRFHWGEMLVYNALLYAPTALLGASAKVALAVGVFDTLIGHFAHANLRWRIGWLKYVINSPQMHIWHHNHPDCGPVNRNFALTLSVWDWLFGTAHLPEHDPARLGFEGIERYPGELPGQWWAPFRALMERNAWRSFVVGIAGNLRRSFRGDRSNR